MTRKCLHYVFIQEENLQVQRQIWPRKYLLEIVNKFKISHQQMHPT